MDRETAKQIALDDINKEIEEKGEDTVIMRCPKPGKNSWTAKEYKYAIEHDTTLEATNINPINDVIKLDNYLIEHRGYGLLDEDKFKKYRKDDKV